MKLTVLFLILSAAFICGCENTSTSSIPVTTLPPSSTGGSQEKQKPDDFFADEQSARETDEHLMAVPECRDYMEKIIKTISAKSSACDSIPSPHDTLIVARFNLHQDGSVTDIAISGNTNAPVAPALVQALKKCSPFPSWPNIMRPVVGKDFCEIYYRFGFNMTSPGPD